jgi:hypothetical protein
MRDLLPGVREPFRSAIRDGREHWVAKSPCCLFDLSWTDPSAMPQPPQARCSGCRASLREYLVIRLGGGRPPAIERVRQIEQPRRTPRANDRTLVRSRGER